MKTNYILILFLITILSVNGQEQDKYFSQEAYDYLNQEKTITKYEPLSVSQINSIKYDFVKEVESTIDSNSFISTRDETDYAKSFHSLVMDCVKEFHKTKKTRDDNLAYHSCMDSINLLRFSEKIGDIYKYHVIRHDSIGNKQIIVYYDSKYESPLKHQGYWIGISEDSGNNWKYYYSGLAKDNIYFIKPNPKIDLIKSDSIICLEAAKVRKVKRSSHWTASEYELIKDNIILELNLNKITLDTDLEGLTDLEEQKLQTNPTLKDTDKDGLLDLNDNNPRFPNLDDRFSRLYSTLIEFQPYNTVFIPFNGKIDFIPDTIDNSFPSSTFLIKTDDEKIQGLNPFYICKNFVTSC